jgi:hypothetical protein
MDVLLGLAVIIAVVLAVRSGLRSSTEARERAEAARRALAEGARGGMGPDRSPTEPAAGGMDEVAARLREDAAFFEGVVFSNYLLPPEMRERLPGYREHDDGEIDPADLTTDPYDLLDTHLVDGDDTYLLDEFDLDDAYGDLEEQLADLDDADDLDDG